MLGEGDGCPKQYLQTHLHTNSESNHEGRVPPLERARLEFLADQKRSSGTSVSSLNYSKLLEAGQMLLPSGNGLVMAASQIACRALILPEDVRTELVSATTCKVLAPVFEEAPTARALSIPLLKSLQELKKEQDMNVWRTSSGQKS